MLSKTFPNLISYRSFLFVLIGLYIGIFFFTTQYLEPRPRSEHYLQSKNIIEQFKSRTSDKNKISEMLQKDIDNKFTYYEKKVTSFYLTITYAIVFCILGIIALQQDHDVGIPMYPETKIPIRVIYIVIPVILCYNWLQFGFYLHHIIEARASLFNLINAQYALNHPEVINPNGTVTISYEAYYTLTRANDLKDTGFIDSWFLQFLPQWFPSAKLTYFDKIMPIGTMMAIGLLFGVSHGLQIALPYNWLVRFKPKLIVRFTIVFILSLIIFFLSASHFSFYYSGRNPNWLQYVILMTGFWGFGIITAKAVREWYVSNNKQADKLDEATGKGFIYIDSKENKKYFQKKE